MKKILYTFLWLSCLSAFAQRPSADAVETSKGTLTIQPLQHATMALTFNGKTIYVDPQGGAKIFEGIAEPDIVLITDIHGDHFNPETLAALSLSNAILIAPQAVADKMSETLKAKTVVINNGQSIEKLGITINAVPMYNLPETAESRHPKGRGNGYVLTLGNKKLYISGDTSGINEMKDLKNIDIAFVCMNLPYTMDINEAANAVLAFKPKIVYPFHYRGTSGLSDTEAFKKLVKEGSKNVDVRLRDWYSK